MIMPIDIQPDEQWLHHPATLALKAQHEAALASIVVCGSCGGNTLRERDCDLCTRRQLEAALAEAQREIERLKQKVASAETYGEKERGHFEHWFKRAEQAEAQVKDERAGKFAMHKIAGEWEDQVRALRDAIEYNHGKFHMGKFVDCASDLCLAAIPPAPEEGTDGT